MTKLFLLLKEQTPICKVCFKSFDEKSIHLLLNNYVGICDKCIQRYKPIFKEFKFESFPGLAIYEYTDYIKEKLFQFKGCFDYELCSTFLGPYKHELMFRYRGFVVVPIPSNKEADLERGFNHVETIFESVGFKLTKILEKRGDFKQALHNSKERGEISKHLFLKENLNLENSKILLVDDVITTGSTMHRAIELIKTLKPKKIEVLVMSKRMLNIEKKK